MANPARPEGVGQFIEKRLSDLSAADKNYMRGLASAILAAGRALELAAPDEAVDLDEIPTNGDAFGDEWEGKRVKWFGEWNIPGEDEWYPFSGTYPAIPTHLELETYAAELAFGWAEQYGKKFLHKLDAFPGEVRVRIIGQEKGF